MIDFDSLMGGSDRKIPSRVLIDYRLELMRTPITLLLKPFSAPSVLGGCLTGWRCSQNCLTSPFHSAESTEPLLSAAAQRGACRGSRAPHPPLSSRVSSSRSSAARREIVLLCVCQSVNVLLLEDKPLSLVHIVHIFYFCLPSINQPR